MRKKLHACKLPKFDWTLDFSLDSFRLFDLLLAKFIVISSISPLLATSSSAIEKNNCTGKRRHIPIPEYHHDDRLSQLTNLNSSMCPVLWNLFYHKSVRSQLRASLKSLQSIGYLWLTSISKHCVYLHMCTCMYMF